MRITKKVREEAALICAIASSNSWLKVPEANPAIDGWNYPPVALACEAWRAARTMEPCGPVPWAEAEAMLRTGWVPDGQ